MSANSSTGSSDLQDPIAIPLPPGRFLLVVIAPAIAVLCGFGWVNWYVDPYGVFGNAVPGVNDKKPRAYGQDRLFKVHDVERKHPSRSIAGTSRVGMGFDVDHPALGDDAYNMGITGADLYECFRVVQHMHALEPQQRVVFGMDFSMFDARGRHPGFRDERLRATASGRVQLRSFFHDLPAVLWSLDAWEDSRETLAAQWDRRVPHHRYYRGRFDPAPMEFYVEQWGHEYRFQFQEILFANKFLDFGYHDRIGREAQLAHLRSLLAFARREGIELHLFFTPTHARLNEVMAAAGLWETFEEIKRDVVATVAEEAEESGEEPFPLWDFATYHPLTTESAGEVLDTSHRMRWYWETSHFKAALGDVVLDRMFAHEAGIPADPLPAFAADFGSTLDPAHLDAHLDAVRARQLDWRDAHPEDFDRLETYLEVLEYIRTNEDLPPELKALEEQYNEMVEKGMIG